MTFFRLVSCFLILLIVSGCVATRSQEVDKLYRHPIDAYSFKINNRADVPEKAVKIFEKKLAQKLAKQNLYDPESPRQLSVTFNLYGKKHWTWGFLIGYFDGIERVKSTITILDSRTGKKDGKFKVQSETFAPFKSKYLLFKDHAEEISLLVKDDSLTWGL